MKSLARARYRTRSLSGFERRALVWRECDRDTQADYPYPGGRRGTRGRVGFRALRPAGRRFKFTGRTGRLAQRSRGPLAGAITSPAAAHWRPRAAAAARETRSLGLWDLA